MPGSYVHIESNELVPVDLFWSTGVGNTLISTIVNQSGGGGVQPSGWPPHPGQVLGLFVGDATATADGGKSWLTVYPQINSSYYEYVTRLTVANTAAMTAEAARISRGEWILVTQKAGKDGLGSSTTSPPYLMSSALDPTNANYAAAVAWWDQYIAALKQLSEVDQTKVVMASVQHEYVNNVEKGNVSGPDADVVMYGQFLSWFTDRVHATAPLVRVGVWFDAKDGGGQVSTQTERLVLANITSIDWIGADFYTSSSHALTDTLSNAWGRFSWITGSADYTRLGSPPLVAPEFGVSKEYNSTLLRTDAQIQSYYSAVRTQMVAKNICVAVAFLRDSGPNGNYDITPTQTNTTLDYPLARAELTNQVTHPV